VERIKITDEVVGCHDQQHWIGTLSERHVAGKRQRGRCVAACGLDDQAWVAEADLAQLLDYRQTIVLVGDHDWIGGDGHVSEAPQSERRLLQQ
jgi:hypothetical protein